MADRVISGNARPQLINQMKNSNAVSHPFMYPNPGGPAKFKAPGTVARQQPDIAKSNPKVAGGAMQPIPTSVVKGGK